MRFRYYRSLEEYCSMYGTGTGHPGSAKCGARPCFLTTEASRAFPNSHSSPVSSALRRTMGKIKFGVRPHAIPKRKVLMKHQKGPKAKSRTSKGVTKASKEPTPKVRPFQPTK